MPGRLQDRVAIITGASSGLGRAISFTFATEGAKCFLVDKYDKPRNPLNSSTGKADDWNNRTGEQLQTSKETRRSNAGESQSEQPNPADEASMLVDIVARIRTPIEPTHEILASFIGQDRVMFHQADLTDEASVQKAVSSCVKQFDRLDILINSHGISVESTHLTPLRCHETTLSDFTLTQDINTTSLFLTCKHALSQFLNPRQLQLYSSGRGWIVNVASVQGLTPYYATPSYCASKGAVVMLTKQIALDYAHDGIRCNAICPGFLNTDMTRNLQGQEDVLRKVEERQVLAVSSHPSGSNTESGRIPGVKKGGLGRVEDVARMVLVLAGDDSMWYTGQAVVVDGGYTLS